MHLVLVGIFCMAGALVPASAGAATVRVTGGYSSDGNYESMILHYELAGGERSGVVVSGDEFGITLRDPGRTIHPGGGCDSLAPDTVHCGRMPAENCTTESRECPIYSAVAIRLTAESDVVDASGVDRTAVHVKGGGGDDRFIGGSGDDAFFDGDAAAGRLGRDVFDGGKGTDSADYADRRGNVRVDLSTDAGQGERGENDSLLRVESATGGRGDDVMTGGTVGGALSGGPGGDDIVRGGRASDHLTSHGGRDTLSGGGGDDRLTFTSRRGRARVACGAGKDTVHDVRVRDVLEACERVRLRSGLAHVSVGEALRITYAFCARCATVSVRYRGRLLVRRPLRGRDGSRRAQVLRVPLRDRARVRCGSGVVQVRITRGDKLIDGFRWRPPWHRCQ